MAGCSKRPGECGELLGLKPRQLSLRRGQQLIHEAPAAAVAQAGQRPRRVGELLGQAAAVGRVAGGVAVWVGVWGGAPCAHNVVQPASSLSWRACVGACVIGWGGRRGGRNPHPNPKP